MSFRIDDILKPDDKGKRKRLRGETCSHISHIHHEFDDMGGILSYRETSPEEDLLFKKGNRYNTFSKNFFKI